MRKVLSMTDPDRVREGLIASISGARRGHDAADRLCEACVELLVVDGAALSVVNSGAVSRALGSSGEVSRELIEMQFTLGEGPCLDVAASSIAVAVQLDGPDAQQWPTFAREASRLGARMVFVLPVAVVGFPSGTLSLHRNRVEPFDGATTERCFLAAELAVMPLLDLIAIDLNTPINDSTSTAWDDMAALSRAEVYQAVGVLIAQLAIPPAEALARLRGYAFANSRSTSDVAYDIIDHTLRLSDDRTRGPLAAKDGDGDDRSA